MRPGKILQRLAEKQIGSEGDEQGSVSCVAQGNRPRLFPAILPGSGFICRAVHETAEVKLFFFGCGLLWVLVGFFLSDG